MRSYMVGKELRNRYELFLGPTHYFDQIVATSSSQPKCKASTQAILTTLFPAKEYCHEGKLVDYSYINANDDRILLTYLPCQKYLGQLQFSKGCSCKERNYVNLLVSERSGWDNVSLLQLMQVKETIKAQEELDLDIPQWAKPIWKEPLWKCSRNLWRAMAADKKSLSYIGGHLFSKIVSDSMHKAQGNTRNLRLLLYTAHDFNLVALLGILGLYRDQEIGYSEYIAFELHEIDCIVGFKVARHGDRTPTAGTFPNDLQKENKYYPFGPDRLIQKGKERSYMVGSALRKRYGDFLGDTYNYDQIEALTSSYERSRITAQAILAALYPAKSSTDTCREGQLVDFKYLNFKHDKLIASYGSCENIFNVQRSAQYTPCEEHDYLNEYLSEYTGWNNLSYLEVHLVKDALKVQQSMGYSAPEWAKSIWPEPLTSCSLDLWKAIAADKQRLSNGAGYLIKKIAADTLCKKQDFNLNTKLHLYVGHDMNIVLLLAILGSYHGQDIEYSEYLMFEVHRIDGVIGFKVFYENYSGSEPLLLDTSGCGTFCPLDEFIKLVGEYFPVKYCSI